MIILVDDVDNDYDDVDDDEDDDVDDEDDDEDDVDDGTDADAAADVEHIKPRQSNHNCRLLRRF